MPETRDRLSRQDGDMTTYISRRRIVGGGNRNSEVIIMENDVEDQATGSPFRWRGAPMVGTPGPIGVARPRGGLGSSRMGRSPNFGRSSALGRENISPVLGSARGRGGPRGRGSLILPAWYPRKPLRDITAVVRVMCDLFRNLFIVSFTCVDLGSNSLSQVLWWLVISSCMVLICCALG